jgi:hypothetical protein
VAGNADAGGEDDPLAALRRKMLGSGAGQPGSGVGDDVPAPGEGVPGGTAVTLPASAPVLDGPGQWGHVFISYVREDSAAVDGLQAILESAGIPVWRDTDSLWPGEDWRARIRDAIKHGTLVFIACFSSRSAARQRSHQNEELLLAIDQLRVRRPDVPWLVPVRFDDCAVPDLELGGGRTLGSIQRSDLFGADRDRAARRLVEAIWRLLPRPASHRGEPGVAGGYRDSARKLEQARRGQSIPEPGYRDVAERLERARREQVRAEIASLHRAGRWQEVLDLGDRPRQISPGDPGPDPETYELIYSAHAELAAAEHARMLDAAYRRAPQHMDSGEWVAALMDLTVILESSPGYKHAAQLADRVRRELACTRPRIEHPSLMSSVALSARYTRISFSRDDSRLALAGDRTDMSAVVVDLDGRVLLRLRHDQPRQEYLYTYAAAFDAAGRRLVTGGSDDTIRTWDAASGRQLLKITMDEGAMVTDVIFSPDGKMIAVVGLLGNFAALMIDAGSGKRVTQIPPDPSPVMFVNRAAFSPDGRMLATGDNREVQVWDTAGGTRIFRRYAPGDVQGLTFSPDGRMLAAGCGKEDTARIWDTVSGTTFLELPHRGQVRELAFSPDGRMLATAADTARVWDAASGDLLFETTSPPPDSLALSHDGQLMAAVRPGRLELWRLD